MLLSSLKPDFQKGGIVLINKPLYWTSFDIVSKIRNLISRKLKVKNIKVGHAGTLDPLATGLMIICTGKATKQIHDFIDLDKEYRAILKLGETTPSFDLESKVDHTYTINHINKSLVNKVLIEFIGETEQVPPVYSAKYHKGKRAYEFARKGEEIELNPVKIRITDIQLCKYDLPYIEIAIVCSKGTYIRALARDIGEKLKCGAHLTGLTRTAIGSFHLNDAISIEEFQEKLLFL